MEDKRIYLCNECKTYFDGPFEDHVRKYHPTATLGRVAIGELQGDSMSKPQEIPLEGNSAYGIYNPLSFNTVFSQGDTIVSQGEAK
jgi:hypothetical protein